MVEIEVNRVLDAFPVISRPHRDRVWDFKAQIASKRQAWSARTNPQCANYPRCGDLLTSCRSLEQPNTQHPN